VSSASVGERRVLLAASLVVVVGVIATTLAQNVILGKIPLQNLLKNTLHADRSANAAFFFWAIFPWYLKPLVGLVEDAVPLAGTRRRSYLMLGGGLGALAWYCFPWVPFYYAALLAVNVLISLSMVIASTAIGGYMVEVAASRGGAGRLSSLRMIADQFSVLVAGPAGGLLAAFAIGWTAVCCGSIALLIVPVAWWLLRERPAAPAAAGVLREARAQFRAIGSAGTMWATAGLAALFYSAPGVQTALFYIQQNDLHMSTDAQGVLLFLSGGGGMLAAALYGAFGSRRFTLRALLMGCLILGACGNLAYLFYDSAAAARLIECFNGFGYTMAEVALMHLCVRATPAGSEALGFSLLMSVRNFCLYGSDWLGSTLLDRAHLQFHTLVLMNGATTLLAVPLVLLLPSAIVRAP